LNGKPYRRFTYYRSRIFGLDLERIWMISQAEVPELKERIVKPDKIDESTDH